MGLRWSRYQVYLVDYWRAMLLPLVMTLGGIVARNIRRLRLERGLTQEELAARIRITRNYVGMIERQENSPTVAILERIAKALGIDPARLFDEKAAGRKAE